MFKKFAGLAALAVATTACHSNGTYLQSAEPMPYGPGVVDCHWFQRTENAYVMNACRTPGPVRGLILTSPVAPRAPQVPNVICPVDETVTTSVGGGYTALPADSRGAVVARVNAPAVRAPSVSAPAVSVSTVGVDRDAWNRPARVAAGRDMVDAGASSVAVRMPAVPTSPVMPAVPEVPSATVTISPGVNFGDAVPTWDEPVPPPKPGARLPSPASINIGGR